MVRLVVRRTVAHRIGFDGRHRTNERMAVFLRMQSLQFLDFTVDDPSVPSGRVLPFAGPVNLPDDGLVLQQPVDHKGQNGRFLRRIERQERLALEPFGYDL